MKCSLFLIIFVLLPIALLAEPVSTGKVPQDWLNTAVEGIEQEEYQVTLQTKDHEGREFREPRYHVTNRANNLRAYFDEQGMELHPRLNGDEWRIIFRLNQDNVIPVISADTISYDYGEMNQSFVNTKDGIYQRIISYGRDLSVKIESGLDAMIEGNGLAFRNGREKIRYEILSIEGARGYDISEDGLRIDREKDAPLIVLARVYGETPLAEEGLGTSGTTGLDTIPAWTGESNQAGAEYGYSVSTAGDVNGDGYSDVIIGAPQYDNGQTNEGRAYVYQGSASGLSSTPNWTAESNQANAQFGTSVSTAGDVNGDGYSDVIVGAPSYDNGETNEGMAFVYHGSLSGLSLAPSWAVEGNQAGAQFGTSVSTAGDANGEWNNWYSDVIIGAPYYDNGQTDEGRAFAYYGSSSGLSEEPDWTAESNMANALFGFSVSTAGDVNSDYYSDVIVGAYLYGNIGMVFVYHGAQSGLSITADWVAQSGARFGYSVSTAGDVNGDSYADVIIGAPYYTGGALNEGRAYVYYGSSDGLSLTPNWFTQSGQLGAYFGNSVSTAGDVNGDGYSDVIIGVHCYDNGESNEGRVCVYYGGSSGLPAVPVWIAESNQVDAYFGISVSTAGDVNGDGYSDMIIGAQRYDSGQSNEGRAWVYVGSPTGLSLIANWTTESDQTSAQFGYCVSTAGDVNGDGYSDVIIGAPYFDQGQTDEGTVFAYHGPALTFAGMKQVDQANALFGYCVSTAGDVNGDGYSDVIVGAVNYDNGQTDEGRAFVYNGSASGLSPAPDWTAESNMAGAAFGNSVSTAGDVNGDGYSDVVVGAYLYGSVGMVFGYNGSLSGLSGASDWTAQPDQTGAHFGQSVSTAGDVNRDGYSDVIVGAANYDNGQTDEGKVYVYYGPLSGLGIPPDWTAESNQAGAWFGNSVSTAGDVNGDGYSDVIIAAVNYDNGQTDEGRAFAYYGSASGLSITPNWTAESNQASAVFGHSVATAGDVNGDGYSDVTIGVLYYDNGETNEGRAYVYHGSPAGLASNPAWTAESNQANAVFGHSAATAGDVNGDGYSDVIVGAPYYDNGQSNEGMAFLYYGNGGPGLSLLPRQKVPGLGSHLVQLLNATGTTEVLLGLSLIGTPAGMAMVKLQWETKELGTLMNGTGLGTSSSWQYAGQYIWENVSGLLGGTAYHWRMRIKYSPLYYQGGVYSRWLSIGPNSWNEKDFVTTALIGIGEGEHERGPGGDAMSVRVYPNPFNPVTTITFAVPERTRVRLVVFDMVGRVVATIVNSQFEAGGYSIPWDGKSVNGTELSSGVYVLRLETGGFVAMRKLVLLR